MKKIISKTLERFPDANFLRSEAARDKIASEILKSLAVAILSGKIDNNARRSPTGDEAAHPAGAPPSSTGRNFIKFDSAGI